MCTLVHVAKMNPGSLNVLSLKSSLKANTTTYATNMKTQTPTLEL